MQLSHNLRSHKKNLNCFEPLLLCIHMIICECKHCPLKWILRQDHMYGSSADICLYNEVGDKKMVMIW